MSILFNAGIHKGDTDLTITVKWVSYSKKLVFSNVY